MKSYFYIMSTKSRDSIHVGTTTDVTKMIKFYNKLPRSLIDGSIINHLVYLEEYTTPENSHERFEQVSKFTMIEKKALIETVNPEYTELTIDMIN